jgi:fatty-acyl-CoA synthase
MVLEPNSLTSQMHEAPPQWENLIEMLEGAATHDPRRGLTLIDARGGQEFRTYGQILEGTLRMAAALQSRGIKAGDRVLLAQPTSFDFLTSLFGVVALAAVPVPLSVPRDHDPLESVASMTRWVRLARRYDASALLCGETQSGLRRLMTAPGSPLSLVGDVAGLLTEVPVDAAVHPVRAQSRDLAYIQSTAGASGAPRGVMLSHGNILSNVEAIGKVLAVKPDDVAVSWLPLDNVMGLVGALFFSIYWGIDIVLMSPERFLKRPSDWFWAIHVHKGTLSLAPNFAYNYCVRRCKESNLEGLKLQGWRVAMNGSEPVRAQHMQSFVKRFHPYGIKENIFVPVYGLSEATVAVTFHRPKKPLVIDGINRATLSREGRAEPLGKDGAPVPHERMHVVSVGEPLEGVELKIVDANGQLLGERELGEVALYGPTVMKGYVEKSLEGRDDLPSTRLHGPWLHTGDLGYIADGHLYWVGRLDDCFTLDDGRRIFPEEVELFVNSVDGVRTGSATVFDFPAAAPQNDAKRNGLAIAFETQAGADEDEICSAIKALLARHLDLHPDVLCALPPRGLPRTASGKVRRYLTRKLYLEGKLDGRGTGPIERLVAPTARMLMARVSAVFKS